MYFLRWYDISGCENIRKGNRGGGQVCIRYREFGLTQYLCQSQKAKRRATGRETLRTRKRQTKPRANQTSHRGNREHMDTRDKNEQAVSSMLDVSVRVCFETWSSSLSSGLLTSIEGSMQAKVVLGHSSMPYVSANVARSLPVPQDVLCRCARAFRQEPLFIVRGAGWSTQGTNYEDRDEKKEGRTAAGQACTRTPNNTQTQTQPQPQPQTQTPLQREVRGQQIDLRQRAVTERQRAAQKDRELRRETERSGRETERSGTETATARCQN
jgi:hypothetical protein